MKSIPSSKIFFIFLNLDHLNESEEKAECFHGMIKSQKSNIRTTY